MKEMKLISTSAIPGYEYTASYYCRPQFSKTLKHILIFKEMPKSLGFRHMLTVQHLFKYFTGSGHRLGIKTGDSAW